MLIGVLSVYSSQYRQHKIGRLWDTFFDSCSKPWQRSWQIPGAYFFFWPANRNVATPWNDGKYFRGPVCGSAASYWIGARNWTDPEGNVLPKYVSEIGWWFYDDENISIPLSIKKLSRREPPKVYVDGSLVTPPFPESLNDELDPNIPSDESIVNEVRTSIGVDMKRTTYAYQNHHFQDMIMIETIFTNTGNVDRSDEVEIPNQVLNDVYFDRSIRPTPSREGHHAVGGYEWWGSEWCEYYGENYADYVDGDPSADSLRVFFSWDGDETETSPGLEDLGDPHPVTGQFLSQQYVGMAPIYADKSPTEKVNDLKQPETTRWEGYAKAPSTSKSDNGIPAMYDFMTMGHRDSPLEEGMANTGMDAARQPSLHIAYGPYQMQPDDTWRMVHAEIINGLPVEACIKYGADYKADPDGFTWTNEKTGVTYTGLEAKNALIGTGKDSLFKYVKLANWLFENDFNCPDPPMPPTLKVRSFSGKIVVEWGDEPESEPDPDTGVIDFEGYKLYRAQARYDSTNWELVYDGTGHRYEDEGVTRGIAYYYTITAYDDGTQNTWGINPGEKLESSKFLAMSTVPAYRMKDAENKLNMVDVVPNPFNINASEFQYPGESNKIMFVNLTPLCTIYIYTVSGDKVATIEHISGSGEESWFQVTDSNQYITSGLYIYHIVARDLDGYATGDEVTGKFVVVR